MRVLFSLPITPQGPLFANLNTWACLEGSKEAQHPFYKWLALCDGICHHMMPESITEPAFAKGQSHSAGFRAATGPKAN